MKILYCPKCGEKYGESIIYSCDKEGKLYCSGCSEYVKLQYTIYDREYYKEQAKKRYPNLNSIALDIKKNNLIDEEIRNNPEFDKGMCNTKETRHANHWLSKNQTHQPKCPTCASTNISKISTASKVVGAAAFGLFSKTARSQFKCNNCGYKW